MTDKILPDEPEEIKKLAQEVLAQIGGGFSVEELQASYTKYMESLTPQQRAKEVEEVKRMYAEAQKIWNDMPDS